VVFLLAPSDTGADTLTDAVGVEQNSRDTFFDSEKTAQLAALALFFSLLLFFIKRASAGESFYIRPIEAVSMMNDAVGRATEMGRPVMYAPGLGSLTDPVTVASLNLLSKVAYKGSLLHTKTLVPNYGPLTWPVAQEVVRQAYIKAGKGDEYDPDDVPYFTSRSFTYAAATAGMMVRKKTATNFLIGHFFSESLILAETGAASGALQIGGTDSVEQLPFFITTCDSTMIGEEIFAASVFVSRDPVSVSSIRASDWFKAVVIALLIAGLLVSILLDCGIAQKVGSEFENWLLFFRKGEWL